MGRGILNMKKSIKQAVDEFVKLVGGKSWKKITSRCSGKWAGTYDYGIVIDGRIDVFVTNGMTHFEERILEWCESIRSFHARKEEYLCKVRELAERDNQKAIAEGLLPVTVVDIGIVSPEATDGFHFLRPYVLLEVNGKQHKFSESGFCYAILNDGIDKWLAKGDRPLWTAGGVKNPDFAFCGVRFNSEDGIYCIR
jgi:hypothetical protein